MADLISRSKTIKTDRTKRNIIYFLAWLMATLAWAQYPETDNELMGAILSERMHTLMLEALNGAKIDAAQGFYPRTEPDTIGDVVIQAVQVTKDSVYLVPGKTPSSDMFLVAPIKIDVAAISGAKDIPTLIAAFGAPKGRLDIEHLVPNWQTMSTTGFFNSSMAIGIEIKIASIINQQLVLLTYKGIVHAGQKPIFTRRLFLESLTVNYEGQ